MDDRPKTRAPYVWMLLVLAALVNLPLLHATFTDARIEGGGGGILAVTLVVDAVLVVIALMVWRVGGRMRPQLRAIAVEDVERCKPEQLLERVEGETYLIRGEVTTIEPGQVVIDVGGRTVLVYLDGHHNPVGYQQPAQVRARLV